jgi:hypothetical protein
MAYQTLGYEVGDNASLEAGFEKIAIYSGSRCYEVQ